MKRLLSSIAIIAVLVSSNAFAASQCFRAKIKIVKNEIAAPEHVGKYLAMIGDGMLQAMDNNELSPAHHFNFEVIQGGENPSFVISFPYPEITTAKLKKSILFSNFYSINHTADKKTIGNDNDFNRHVIWRKENVDDGFVLQDIMLGGYVVVGEDSHPYTGFYEQRPLEKHEATVFQFEDIREN